MLLNRGKDKSKCNGYSARWGGPRGSFLPEPKVTSTLGLKSPPSDAGSSVPTHDLDSGWAGRRGEGKTPMLARGEAGSRLPGVGAGSTELAWAQRPLVISDGGAVPGRIACPRSGNKPIMILM